MVLGDQWEPRVWRPNNGLLPSEVLALGCYSRYNSPVTELEIHLNLLEANFKNIAHTCEMPPASHQCRRCNAAPLGHRP